MFDKHEQALDLMEKALDPLDHGNSNTADRYEASDKPDPDGDD